MGYRRLTYDTYLDNNSLRVLFPYPRVLDVQPVGKSKGQAIRGKQASDLPRHSHRRRSHQVLARLLGVGREPMIEIAVSIDQIEGGPVITKCRLVGVSIVKSDYWQVMGTNNWITDTDNQERDKVADRRKAKP